MAPSVLLVLVVWGQTTDYWTLRRQGLDEFSHGRFAAAEKLFIEALSHLQPADELERAGTLADLGVTYSRQEQLSKAEHTLGESLSIYQRRADKDASAIILSNLGLVYSQQGRVEDAFRLLTSALESIKHAPEKNVFLYAQVLNGIGVLHYRRGNNGKAERFFKQVLELVSDSSVRFDTGAVLNNLGAVYVMERKFKPAEETLNRALQIKEANIGLSHPDLIAVLNSLGVMYTRTHRYAEAESQYRRALEILKTLGDVAPASARILRALAATYRSEGLKDESNLALKQAAQLAREHIEQPEMAVIVDEYSALLRTQGKTQEAEMLHAEAKRARVISGLVVTVQP